MLPQHFWYLRHFLTTPTDVSKYRMVGKFDGNLIWRIGLQYHLADFNLAVLFLRAMMSYVIVPRRICNPNALASSNVRSRCRSGNMEAELCIESWTFLDKSFEKCLTAFAGPCSAANFPICTLSSDVYSLYLPRPEVSSSCTRFITFAFVFSTCLSEREGTFVGYVRRSLVKYLYNAIFKASFTLVSDTSREKFPDPTHQMTSWNIGGI